jgi:NAD(P)-dependent dehydrogenase (short-subunit alcohol dehydrogenase family)
MPELGTIIVTGGASGLGAAVAQAVADEGGTPYVIDVHEPASGFEFVQADLSDTEAATDAVRQIGQRAGRIDGVFTAAGTDACGPLDEVSTQAWEKVVKTNLLGTVAVVREALPYLKKSHGTVVTCGSTLGIKAVSDATAYCSSKFGITGFTRALAAETAGQIGVTHLIPGGMDTHFFDGRTDQYKPPPDAKLNRPEDTAGAVLFALRQPPGCEVRELVVAASEEGSWP